MNIVCREMNYIINGESNQNHNCYWLQCTELLVVEVEYGCYTYNNHSDTENSNCCINNVSCWQKDNHKCKWNSDNDTLDCVGNKDWFRGHKWPWFWALNQVFESFWCSSISFLDKFLNLLIEWHFQYFWFPWTDCHYEIHLHIFDFGIDYLAFLV